MLPAYFIIHLTTGVSEQGYENIFSYNLRAQPLYDNHTGATFILYHTSGSKWNRPIKTPSE